MYLASYCVIAVCTTVYGFLFHGPVFGKQWMKLSGIKEPGAEEKKKMMLTMLRSVAINTVSYVFLIAVFHSVLRATGTDTSIQSAIGSAVMLWLGFIATSTLNAVLWEGASIKLYLFRNSYYLTQFILIAVLLVVII